MSVLPTSVVCLPFHLFPLLSPSAVSGITFSIILVCCHPYPLVASAKAANTPRHLSLVVVLALRLYTYLQAFISGCYPHPPAICLLNLSIFPCLSPKPIAYLFISVYWQTSVFVCHPPDRVTLISARDNTPKGIIGEYVYGVESRLQPLSFSLSNYCLAADGKSRLLLLTMSLILPRMLTISTPSSGYPFACRRQLAAVGCCLFPVGVCFPLQAMCLLIWLSSVACYLPGGGLSVCWQTSVFVCFYVW